MNVRALIVVAGLGIVLIGFVLPSSLTLSVFGGGQVCASVPSSLNIATNGCPTGQTPVLFTGGGACSLGPCGSAYWVQIASPAVVSSITIDWGDGTSATQSPALPCTTSICTGAGYTTYYFAHTYNVQKGNFTVKASANVYGVVVNAPPATDCVGSNYKPGVGCVPYSTSSGSSTTTTSTSGGQTTVTTTFTMSVTTTINSQPPAAQASGPNYPVVVLGFGVAAFGVIRKKRA